MEPSESPLVSCVCVTRNKPDKLKRAIDCFLAQSHENKELVVVYETDDLPTASFLQSYSARPEIRCHGVDVTPKRTLGELRNVSIERSRGEYFCQWDDDDWYHVDRIREQLAAVVNNHQTACLLTNWLMFDVARRQAYFSLVRLWEGSILCRRDVLINGIKYPAMARQEDSFFMNALIAESRVYPLVMPILYIYEAHGGNTWSGSHFEQIFSMSQPLSEAVSKLILDILDGVYSVEEASQMLRSSRVLGELKYFYVNNMTMPNGVALR
jgi:glycosyltransferase involved in cell wall biosynthesis